MPSFVNCTIKEKFKVQLKRKTCVLLCCLTVLLCFADIAVGVIETSDAQKKNVVYRMYANYKKDFPAVSDILPQRAMELLNQETIVFVDTRRPEEIAVSMLPGAVSKQDFLSHRDLYRDKIVVVYCTISYRSGVFAREMSEQGIHVVNLQGGILAWILEGGKVYDQSGKEVKRVHVYDDKWDYAAAGYESVKFSLWEQMLSL
jgi:sodium/bile acid cotransporter 7